MQVGRKAPPACLSRKSRGEVVEAQEAVAAIPGALRYRQYPKQSAWAWRLLHLALLAACNNNRCRCMGENRRASAAARVRSGGPAKTATRRDQVVRAIACGGVDPRNKGMAAEPTSLPAVRAYHLFLGLSSSILTLCTIVCCMQWC